MLTKYKEHIWLNILPLEKQWDVLIVGNETSLSSNLLSDSVKKLIISDFDKLDFPKHSFDLIILCKAEMLKKNEQSVVIQKVNKILKNSGFFVVIITNFCPFKSYKYKNLLQGKFKEMDVFSIFPSYTCQIFAFSLNKKSICKASEKLLEGRYSIKSIMGYVFLNIIAFVKLYKFYFVSNTLFFMRDKIDATPVTQERLKKDIVLIRGRSRNNICILNGKKILKIPKIQTEDISILTEFVTIKNLEKSNISNIPNQKLERRGDTFLLASDYYGDPLLSAQDIRFSKLNNKNINDKITEIMNWLITEYQRKIFSGKFEKLDVNLTNLQLGSYFGNFKNRYTLPFGKIHGDFVHKNILYSDNGKFVIIDFEYSREDFLLFDLIYFYVHIFTMLSDKYKIKDNFFEILAKRANKLLDTYIKTIKMFAEEYGFNYKNLLREIIPMYIMSKVDDMTMGGSERTLKKIAIDHREYFSEALPYGGGLR